MLMQACLGLRRSTAGRARSGSTRPRLPIGIDNLFVRHLAVGEAAVDVVFERVGDRVVCYLDRRHEGLVPFVVGPDRAWNFTWNLQRSAVTS